MEDVSIAGWIGPKSTGPRGGPSQPRYWDGGGLTCKPGYDGSPKSQTVSLCGQVS